MVDAKKMTWGLRIATFSIGILLVIQGELLMAFLLFMLTGGIEWYKPEENSEKDS